MSEMIQSDDRKAVIKKIVRGLNDQSDINQIRAEFSQILQTISPEEISQIEQELIEEGVPVEEMQKLCELHVEVFEKVLKRQPKTRTYPGHPIHTYRQENKALKKRLKQFKKQVKESRSSGQSEPAMEALADLEQLELHYARKENQLFPYLEQVGFTGPSKVMWGKHDEIRAMLKALRADLTKGDFSGVTGQLKGFKTAIKRMIFMEERILFPTALRKLTDATWMEIRKGESEIGYAWIQPGNVWDPTVVRAAKLNQTLKDAAAQSSPKASSAGSASESALEAVAQAIDLDTGSLTPDQINMMIKVLPLDITFVDEHDKVRYYSDSAHRIFPRSPGIIGRDVANCHPPKSVHVVEKIVQAFKNKEKSNADFWIRMGETLAYIRYFPVYDDEGIYRGTVELSMDAAPIQALEGERRILDWD